VMAKTEHILLIASSA